MCRRYARATDRGIATYGPYVATCGAERATCAGKLQHMDRRLQHTVGKRVQWIGNRNIRTVCCNIRTGHCNIRLARARKWTANHNLWSGRARKWRGIRHMQTGRADVWRKNPDWPASNWNTCNEPNEDRAFALRLQPSRSPIQRTPHPYPGFLHDVRDYFDLGNRNRNIAKQKAREGRAAGRAASQYLRRHPSYQEGYGLRCQVCS